ncbi:glycogen-binding subunit 76A-like protein [Dinothrombium tinctorium]|uniref:Glycogen-binding subunit 76A-like protein n=1 Tax=Dinothrombium tinctorium TaxID=1965070 RepID=A0A3S4QW85_9ACAR|nr:glycogen-binding subunit 76A-like protein [Dinothrombium tinctorium]RWS09201.1 glycogen-binding subunit 76A-like protein [Dinothrombium tinctorium]RWS12910.1 glycogen-binding subunit 76A-like protein [Dinothrombium tinctorium]
MSSVSPIECNHLDDDDHGRCVRGKLAKSTSLKTSTNKSGPQRRKSVHFADAFGLNLECVHLIYGGQPNVPSSAFSHLNISNDLNGLTQLVNDLTNCDAVYNASQSKILKLNPDFVEPFTLADFFDRVRSQKVCLQNCFVTNLETQVNIHCIILVINLSFEKNVKVRYTKDNWRTWSDLAAKYVPNSNNGWSDKFMVELCFNTNSTGELVAGQKVSFAICFSVDGREYWDNNLGSNYSFICSF